MKTLIAILLLLTSARVAHARLGETPDEVTARYGAGSVVTGTNDESFIEYFHYNSFNVEVTFWKGKCAREVLYKRMADEPAMIFQDDGDKLFQEVSDGGQIKADRSGHSSMYTNKSNGATGMLLDDSLSVSSKEWTNFLDKKICGKDQRILTQSSARYDLTGWVFERSKYEN